MHNKDITFIKDTIVKLDSFEMSRIRFNNGISFKCTTMLNDNNLIITSNIYIPTNMHLREFVDSVKVFTEKYDGTKIYLLQDSIISIYERFNKEKYRKFLDPIFKCVEEYKYHQIKMGE